MGGIVVIALYASGAKILQHPWILVAFIGVCFRFDSRQVAKLSKPDIRTRATSQENRSVRERAFCGQALEVDNTIHWTAK